MTILILLLFLMIRCKVGFHTTSMRLKYLNVFISGLLRQIDITDPSLAGVGDNGEVGTVQISSVLSGMCYHLCSVAFRP